MYRISSVIQFQAVCGPFQELFDLWVEFRDGWHIMLPTALYITGTRALGFLSR